MDAIRLTLDYLRDPKAEQRQLLATSADPFQVLSSLLIEAGHIVSQGGPVSESDIQELLQQFYQDDAIDVAVRLRLLQTIPADFSSAVDQSGTRVQLLRTLDLIQKNWSANENVMAWSKELGAKDIDSQQRRLELFMRLLEISHSATHLAGLAKLLHFWSPFLFR